MVGQAEGDLEQRAFAGRLEISDGGLDQVPGAVGFVHVFLFDQRLSNSLFTV